MIPLATAQLRATESLAGFSPEIPAAYLSFAEKGDPRDLDTVIFGVLQFYLAQPPTHTLASVPGSTRLVEDLGCDSLTMMDTVFMVEGLFDLKLEDEKLAQLSTLDDLREHLRSHFKSLPAPSGLPR